MAFDHSYSRVPYHDDHPQTPHQERIAQQNAHELGDSHAFEYVGRLIDRARQYADILDSFGSITDPSFYQVMENIVSKRPQQFKPPVNLTSGAKPQASLSPPESSDS